MPLIDRSQRKKVLLDKLAQLLHEGKLKSFSLRDLAAQLNLSTGTFYTYFNGNEALFEELVEHVTKNELHLLESLVQNIEGSRQRSLALIKYVEENEKFFLERFRMYIKFRELKLKNKKTNKKKDHLYLAAENYSKQLAEILSVSQEKAILIIAAFEGIILKRFIDLNYTDFRTTAKIFIDLLFPEEKN